jgi:hypothetical protein
VKYTLAILLFAASCLPVLAQQAPADGGKWREHEQIAEMDNNKTTSLLLDAELQTAGVVGPTTATLIVRCSGTKRSTLEAYVSVGDIVEALSYNPYWANVRTKFDDGKPTTKGWFISEDHTAVSTRHEKDFVKMLAASQTFLFEFKPYQKNLTEIKFDVRGLTPHLDKISNCLK